MTLKDALFGSLDMRECLHRHLEENLYVDPDEHSTNARVDVVRIRDAALRLPMHVTLPQARLIVPPEECRLPDFADMLDAKEIPYEHDLDAADALPAEYETRMRAETTCLGVAEVLRAGIEAVDRTFRGLDEATSAVIPEGAVRGVLGMVEMMGEMDADEKTVEMAFAAIAAHYRAARAEFVECHAAVVGEVRAEHEERVEEALTHLKSLLVEAIVGDAEAYRVPGEHRSVPCYLAEKAGLTQQQIGDAYGVTRQSAKAYVDGTSVPRPRSAADDAAFAAKLREYRDAALASAAAIEDVLEGRVS